MTIGAAALLGSKEAASALFSLGGAEHKAASAAQLANQAAAAAGDTAQAAAHAHDAFAHELSANSFNTAGIGTVVLGVAGGLALAAVAARGVATRDRVA